MQNTVLNNGRVMPMIGFGTWNVRGEEGKKIILAAIETGYRLFDTAQMYENEEIVGQAIRESGIPRDEFFVTTKISSACNASTIMSSIDGTLRRLDMEYVDLLLIHEPFDTNTEMYQGMEEAVRLGKVKTIGVSNFNEKELQEIMDTCSVVPAVNQVESHVYHARLHERDFMKEHGIQMQSWGPFTEGRKDIFHEPVLMEIGKVHGKTSGQIALRYLLQNGICVIPKTAHRERMKENMDLLDFELCEEEMKSILSLDDGNSLFGWY